MKTHSSHNSSSTFAAPFVICDIVNSPSSPLGFLLLCATSFSSNVFNRGLQ